MKWKIFNKIRILFSKRLLSTHYVPDTVLGAETSTVTKTQSLTFD